MHNKTLNIFSYIIVLLVIASTFSCRKELNTTGFTTTNLEFSNSKLLFDTVFTTIGSVTKQFKVYNRDKKTMKFDRIYLANGNASNFRLNVNGKPGVAINDVEIYPNDSIFVFVKVTVDPNNKNSPMIISDSIIFENENHREDIDLVAWGQDANFFVADNNIKGLPPFTIVAKEGEYITWSSTKPYVIYGFAVIDSNATLAIRKGVKVYFHKNSGIWVYKGGSLQVLGTKDEPVVFQGDRLEQYYKDMPGQWDRIWINESSQDSYINYAIIKNGFIGIQAEVISSKMGNSLTISNTIIQNMSGAGILARYFDINGKNLLINNCGQYLVALTLGGNYRFEQCTFANYWAQTSRTTKSLVINNYNSAQSFDMTEAYFGNCILYGANAEEFEIDKSSSGSKFNYKFENCLLKTTVTNTSDKNYFANCIFNQDPKFIDYEKNNYQLNNESPAINTGSLAVALRNVYDLNWKKRTTDGKPDIGAYEKQ